MEKILGNFRREIRAILLSRTSIHSDMLRVEKITIRQFESLIIFTAERWWDWR